MKTYKKPVISGSQSFGGGTLEALAVAGGFAVGLVSGLAGDDRIGQPRLKPLKKVKV